MPGVKTNVNQICPFCNGLEQVDQTCPVCFEQMLDGGQLTDYLGPYSPYTSALAKNFSGKISTDNRCVHLIYCPNCRYDTRIAARTATI